MVATMKTILPLNKLRKASRAEKDFNFHSSNAEKINSSYFEFFYDN